MVDVKYLIIRLSSIGDIVLTTPVLRGLKEQVEGAEVHFLVKSQFASLVRNNPHVDKVHEFSGSLNRTVSELRQEHFDYLIDLHKNLRTYRIKRRLRVMDFSLDKLNRQKWLMVNFKRNKLPDLHIVDRYRHTVHLFDVQDDGKGLDFYIPEGDEVAQEALPAQFREGFYALTVGAGHYTKQMPAADLITLIRLIDKPVVLLGGREDTEKAVAIEKAVGNQAMNACGQFNIEQSGSIIRQARFVIAHDTGLMHIAAALGKHIISLWGNTIPEFGMYPYRPGTLSKIKEVKGLDCRPCTKIGFDQCPKKHFRCMKDLDKQEIAANAQEIWEAGGD